MLTGNRAALTHTGGPRTINDDNFYLSPTSESWSSPIDWAASTLARWRRSLP